MSIVRSLVLMCIALFVLSVPAFAGFLPNTVNCTIGVTPQNGDSPLAVTASGDCAEFDVQGAPVPLTITIDFGDGSPAVTGKSAQHTYTVGARTYTVTITGTDAQQRTGSANTFVSVNNTPPTCTIQVNPNSGSVPLTVTGTGNCTDVDNNISITQIDWGDGTIDDDTESGSHTYNSPGTYIVTLTAFDNSEASESGTATVTVFNGPNIFVSAGDGKVVGLQNDGSIAQTLDTGTGGTITGMMFDFNSNLFVTDFTAGNVTVFSAGDAAARNSTRRNEISSGFFSKSNFGSGYNCQPESVVEDSQGNVYVGLAGCTKNVLKFDSSGAKTGAFTVDIEDQGADWIDLAADDCTLYYTSEGSRVFRYNVCGNRQLSDFASGFHKALAVRLLPDGGVIVADNIDIHRTDISGKIIKTYDATGNDCWVALTIDPSGGSFWASDACTSQVVQFDLASGEALQTIKANVPPNTMYGIASTGFSNNFLFVGSSPQTNTISNGSANYSISVGFGCADNKCSVKRSGVQSGGDVLALSCSNLPVGAKCTFNPPTVSVNGSSSMLTISINNTTVADGRVRPPMFGRPAFLAMFGTFSIAFGVLAVPRRRACRKWLWSAFAISTVLFLIACGTHNTSSNGVTGGPIGTPKPGSTPPGTYNINVNAGNGPLVSSTSIGLTVQ